MNACKTNKIHYKTAAHAAQALRSCIDNGREEKRFYLCPFCGAFHLTSKNEWFDRNPKETRIIRKSSSIKITIFK